MENRLLIPTLIVLGLFLFSGLLALGAAIGNWKWFFHSKNARMLTGRLSHNHARWLYAIVGLFILIMTIIIALDIIATPQYPQE